MERVEALKHFNDEYVMPVCFKKLMALEEFYQNNIHLLADSLLDAFVKILSKIKGMQLEGKKNKIGFITCSMLRTKVLDGTYRFLIEAFDEEWYLDFVECHGEYDAGWAFGFLDELTGELEEKRKKYMGSLYASDLDKIKLCEAKKYNEYIISLARYTMPKVSMLKEFSEIMTEDELEIRFGEYRDASEIVYKMDKRTKDSKEVKEWLEEKIEGEEYAYEVYSVLNLSDGNYKGLDLSYAVFTECNLSESCLEESIMIGSRFKGCKLQNINFTNAIINEIEFIETDLRGSKFNNADGAFGLYDKYNWEMPGYRGVSFEGSNLENVDFRGADLKGAIFVGTNLKGVNFKGANLKEAVFMEKDKHLLTLTEKQIKAIKWIL